MDITTPALIMLALANSACIVLMLFQGGSHRREIERLEADLRAEIRNERHAHSHDINKLYDRLNALAVSTAKIATQLETQKTANA